MNIQEAILSGKPFRRKGWIDDDIYLVYDGNDIALTLETDPSISIELDVQDILAEDWYVREDEPVHTDKLNGNRAHGHLLGAYRIGPMTLT